MINFLEFIEVSRLEESYFAKYIRAVSTREYEIVTRLFRDYSLEDEVSELMITDGWKKASRRLLSLLALISEVNMENYPTWIAEPSNQVEVERLVRL